MPNGIQCRVRGGWGCRPAQLLEHTLPCTLPHSHIKGTCSHCLLHHSRLPLKYLLAVQQRLLRTAQLLRRQARRRRAVCSRSAQRAAAW